MGCDITKFYDDGAYDTNSMFNLMQSLNIESGIKIRKNPVPENMKGSKYRRSETGYMMLVRIMVKCIHIKG